jgi:hypothetical protein
MANYKLDLSCQSKFIPIDFSQQIIPGTFEYALAHIIDNHLDLSGFDTWYNNDKKERRGHPTFVEEINRKKKKKKGTPKFC